jgi:pimeloyl-ACP methyl ester carboxylesterase
MFPPIGARRQNGGSIMRSLSRLFLVATAAWAVTAPGTPAAAQPTSAPAKPTIVLLHGAFAESASWNGVIAKLLKDGYPVIAAANPLRSVKGDASYLSSIVSSVPGDVVLVGHSYAGVIISEAAANAANVKSLVYVAGYAPDVGESAVIIAKRFPEGTLGQTLAKPVTQADGNKDLYIEPTKFWAQFAADVPKAEAAEMAATQRPITEAALGEPVSSAAWKTKPSWFIYGSLDKNIPRSAQAFMAKRANAKEAIEIKGASHVVMISHPNDVAAMIERAAKVR